MKKIPLARKNPNNPQIKAYCKAIKIGMENHHVLPSSKGWIVKKAGASIASSTFNTQNEAVSYGKKIAQKNKTELFTHRKNGRILNRISYK